MFQKIFFRFVVYPAQLLFIQDSHRTRVMIRCSDEYLLIKPRLSHYWTLPGGGIHSNETEEEGALREVKEEVGIVLRYEKLHKVWAGPIINRRLKMNVHLFNAELKQKPPLKLQKIEIAKAKWFKPDEISAVELSEGDQFLLAQIAPDLFKMV